MDKGQISKRFRFRNFRVYQEARQFSLDVRRGIVAGFPAHERYGLSSQLVRALNSVILNIAEGADRGTDKDFAHFLNLAHTSLNEVVACLDIAVDIGYLDPAEFERSYVWAAGLSNQITAFRKRLVERPTK